MKSILLLLLIGITNSLGRGGATSTHLYHREALPGVILVPGDGGAQIEAKLHKATSDHIYCQKNTDWYTIWLNYVEMTPMTINCWTANMVLEYDNVTRRSHNPEGVSIRVPGFGGTETVEYLTADRLYGYFAYIAEALVKLGYIRGQNLKGAPYDFRKAPHELGDYFLRLQLLIEDLYSSTGSLPVVLVAHSLGAPILNYFLNLQTESWRQQHILSLVSLAGAWGGSMKAVKVYAAGDNMGSVLTSLSLRTQQRTNPSLAFLLPDPALWPAHEVLVAAPHGNYTIRDMPAYFRDLGLPAAEAMYHDTRRLLRPTTDPPRTRLHCLYGEGIPTTERLEFAEGYWPSYPTLITGPGDGTVNLRSAAVCNQFHKLQAEPVSVRSFNNTDHMAILRHPDVIKYIVTVAQEEAVIRTAHMQDKLLEQQAQRLRDGQDKQLRERESLQMQDNQGKELRGRESQQLRDSQDKQLRERESQQMQDSQDKELRGRESQRLRDSQEKEQRGRESQQLQDNQAKELRESESQQLRDSQAKELRGRESQQLRDSQEKQLRGRESQQMQDSQDKQLRERESQQLRDSQEKQLRGRESWRIRQGKMLLLRENDSQRREAAEIVPRKVQRTFITTAIYPNAVDKIPEDSQTKTDDLPEMLGDDPNVDESTLVEEDSSWETFKMMLVRVEELDVVSIIAKVDEFVERQWSSAKEQLEAYERLKLIQKIEDEAERKRHWETHHQDHLQELRERRAMQVQNNEI